MVQKPHLTFIPLLDEEQLKIFFRLAMEAWQVVQAQKDKRGGTRTKEIPEDNETNDIARAI